ncbi:MAG: hypothetical protein ABFD52_10915 [Acidobacteriota bacterium]
MRSRVLKRLCGRGLALWVIIIAFLAWLAIIISFEAFYRIKIADFEDKLSSLRTGMTEADVIAVLGKPQFIKKASYYKPTDEAVPPEEDIVEYCYSRKSLQSYETCGIYIDAKRGVVVRVHPYRQPVFFLGSPIENSYLLSFIAIVAATAIM